MQTENESEKSVNIAENPTTQNQLAPDALMQKPIIQTFNANTAEIIITLQSTATNTNVTKGTNLRYRLELSLLNQRSWTSQMKTTKIKMVWHLAPAQSLWKKKPGMQILEQVTTCVTTIPV
jgi:hypothetical protein